MTDKTADVAISDISNVDNFNYCVSFIV